MPPLTVAAKEEAALNPLYATMPPSAVAMAEPPSAPPPNLSHPASIHPDYAGGRTFHEGMYMSGRYELPDVYKQGLRDDQTKF